MSAGSDSELSLTAFCAPPADSSHTASWDACGELIIWLRLLVEAGWEASSLEPGFLSKRVSDSLMASSCCCSDFVSSSKMEGNPWTRRPPIADLQSAPSWLGCVPGSSLLVKVEGVCPCDAPVHIDARDSQRRSCCLSSWNNIRSEELLIAASIQVRL